jgi:6,7-dimethyl-8-ribityllumazine synthase
MRFMSSERPQQDPEASAQGLRIVVIVSRYNAEITEALLEGAQGAFESMGGQESNLTVVRVPGAFELPAVAGVCSRMGKYDGIVALGCLIQGETVHDRVIADAAAHALASISAMAAIPVGFGLLTTKTYEQAMARAGGDKGNKGADTMRACIETHHAIGSIKPRGFGFTQ